MKVSNVKQMVLGTEATLIVAKKMALAFKLGQVVINMRVNG